VPSAGLVIIFIVLEAVGLRGPHVDAMVGLMLAVDRPLDMGRTAVNVTSDTCGAAIIARSEGELGVDRDPGEP
jgi:Na+/H+-dicarboxylate symporter